MCPPPRPPPPSHSHSKLFAQLLCCSFTRLAPASRPQPCPHFSKGEFCQQQQHRPGRRFGVRGRRQLHTHIVDVEVCHRRLVPSTYQRLIRHRQLGTQVGSMALRCSQLLARGQPAPGADNRRRTLRRRKLLSCGQVTCLFFSYRQSISSTCFLFCLLLRLTPLDLLFVVSSSILPRTISLT